MKNNKSYYYKVVVKPDLKQVTQDLHYPVPVKHIDHDGETTVMIICDLSGWAPCTSIYSDTVTNCGQLSDFTDAGHHIVTPQSGSGMYMLCEYNVKYAHYLGNGPIYRYCWT